MRNKQILMTTGPLTLGVMYRAMCKQGTKPSAVMAVLRQELRKINYTPHMYDSFNRHTVRTGRLAKGRRPVIDSATVRTFS